MAAVNFPNSPSVNDTHTSSGSTWKWDGGVWQRLGVAGAEGHQGRQGAAGAQGAQGHQGVQGAVGAQGNQGVQGAIGYANTNYIHAQTLEVVGLSTFNSNVHLKDNDRLQFGDDQDLQIYHNGPANHIVAAHQTHFDVNNYLNLRRQGGNTTDYLARFISGGEVSLYHNDSKRFETTLTGIRVIGDIVGSGSTAYSEGLIVGKQGAEFQGVVTA